MPVSGLIDIGTVRWRHSFARGLYFAALTPVPRKPPRATVIVKALAPVRRDGPRRSAGARLSRRSAHGTLHFVLLSDRGLGSRERSAAQITPNMTARKNEVATPVAT
jgi:hypothetical protein